jgi:putative hydrolase of the HAD superfamily
MVTKPELGHMAQTKFIYFDLGNVICPFSNDLACQNMAKLVGVEKSLVSEVVFDSELQNQYESGLISSDGFYDAFCAAIGSAPDRDQFWIASSDMFELNFRIIPVLAQLRSANFPIGILSSTCEAHWTFICRRFPIIDSYFGHRVLSYEAGSMKPHPAIYQKAIEVANLKPAEIFFVDDRPDNVQGALDCGIDAVLFRDTSQLVFQLAERGMRVNL